ncbi:MAG: hypothetical protein BJ554DRAFT_247, partial [Olpidium bornovanus]
HAAAVKLGEAKDAAGARIGEAKQAVAGKVDRARQKAADLQHEASAKFGSSVEAAHLHHPVSDLLAAGRSAFARSPVKSPTGTSSASKLPSPTKPGSGARLAASPTGVKLPSPAGEKVPIGANMPDEEVMTL